MWNYHKIKHVKRQKKQKQRWKNYFCGNLALTKMTLIMSWTKLPTKSTELTRCNFPPNIIFKFQRHHFRGQLYSQKKKIYRSANQKISFHVSLTKQCSNLLMETNNNIKNDNHIKFCPLDSNRKVKVKFADKHNISVDTFQSFFNSIIFNFYHT